jgi:AmmeMemoRadiSam system protein B/AmmeMemoRadiSam system protein A
MPAVAGQFYPGQPEKLSRLLEELFHEAVPYQGRPARAIMSPHAGYVFSGSVAASAFNQIDRKASYKRVFILASSHQQHFEGASVYGDGDYIIPTGRLKVDRETARLLAANHPAILSNDPQPHLREHSVEVQLPFLHYILGDSVPIVPIILGTSRPDSCQQLAEALRPWFTADNLFVVSTDFSHYPPYKEAVDIDARTKDAIVSNDSKRLMEALKDRSAYQVPGLVTRLCGWTAVLTLAYLTEGNPNLEYLPIAYRNSGDATPYGDKSQVVGYWAISVTEKKQEESEFSLSESDKKTLLQLARETIEQVLQNGKMPVPNASDLPDTLKKPCGAFVTLLRKGQLRGCIGTMIGRQPLYKTVQDMAVSACLHDYRFPPVSAAELEDIEIEISVLSPLQRIHDVSAIELGKHGILMVKNGRSGVFLPQVATETGWTLEEFLGHCARDKAGIGWDGWKTAELYLFTATVFSEKEVFQSGR